MSNYNNFVQDFPERCKNILELFENEASLNNREVTLLLMVATTGLIVPYERLKPPGSFAQPVRDYEKFTKAADQLRSLLASEKAF